MTATDDLRRMLDERGVEWHISDEWHISNEKGATFWTGQFGIGYYARQNDDGETLHMLGVDLTPKQAIAATLGRRTTTRHGKFKTKYGRSVPCCECCGYGIGDERWHFCPSCGAEVVEQ